MNRPSARNRRWWVGSLAAVGVFFVVLNCAVSYSDPEPRESGAASVAPAEPVVGADSSFDYTFGRPIRSGEMSFTDYRKAHASEAAHRLGLDPAQIADGMDTWHWWVGVDNPGFWRDMAKLTGSEHNYTNMKIDILRLLHTVPRGERFKRLGIINDPDCVAADKPDEFGLMIDRMKDGTLKWDPGKFGYSSGIIGLQLFKNPAFDAKKWSIDRYMKNPASVEPPYHTGMACVFCHISFDPNLPPANPEEPKWENLTSAMGNQYLREGLVFGQNVPPTSFIFQYLNTQEPGTSETSRFPSDFINNPTNINSIFRLGDRLKLRHVEKITVEQKTLLESIYAHAGVPTNSAAGELGGSATEPTLAAPHVLTDGADSMGLVMASTRVYVNEGMMHEQWYASWPLNPFNILGSIARGFKPREFDLIREARKDPNSPWMQTEVRMPNMATFLMSYDSFPLPAARRPTAAAMLKRGQTVFADNCASCHSSKRPEHLRSGTAPEDVAANRSEWRELVGRPDFLRDNYLSDDERHSILEIGTNVQRAEGTNAMTGSSWGQMSSQTYKDQKAPQIELTFYNPLTGNTDLHWKGSQAFYRTPTLVSIWATAPYLHNNSVGLYNGDPSVDGRLQAYEDGMEKLLWPARRRGVKSIKVTSVETSLPDMFPGLQKQLKGFEDMDLKPLMLPAGTPVNLVMNTRASSVPALLGAYIKGVLGGRPRTRYKSFVNRRRDAGMKAMTAKMLELDSVPDFIEDRGHTFGAELVDEDKRALIEYMKGF